MKHGTKALTMLLSACLLAGCSLHRVQEITPSVTIPDSYLEEAPPAATDAVDSWWTLFDDPRLDALMEEAFTGNLDLEAAIARLEQLQAIGRISNAGRRPTLSIEGQASREKSPGFFGDNEGSSYRLSAAAAFEIDLWKKLASRRNAARLEAEASVEEVHALYLGLSARLADLYYLAAEQRSQLELTGHTVASFAETLAMVERRYREGLVPALDVYQARQNLAAARARRPQLEASLARAEHALSVLVGRYPESGTGEVAILPTIPEAFSAGLPSELIARRPDVQSSLLQVQASDQRIAAAIAERFPSFNLIGSYGRSSSAFSTGDITGSFWSVAASLLQPVIDGGRRRAETDRSRAEFRQRLAGYRQAVLTAFQEVEDALVSNRTGEQRIVLLKERAVAAEAALRLSKDRYRQGLSDYLPVLTSQGLHFDAQSRLLEARRLLISERIGLARALGGRWMKPELATRLQTPKHKD